MAFTRQDVIVTLMAVLELIKLQKILVHQERLFGKIMITAAANTSDDTTGDPRSDGNGL